MSLSELCVRRPVFATMLVMGLVVLGIFSFRDLGVDLFPKADPATVTVTLQLPGASPDEMASAVVEPMEEALSSISGIDEMTSQRINEGRAQITIKFVLERDINDAASDVREKVAGGLKYVPPQVLPFLTFPSRFDATETHAHRCRNLSRHDTALTLHVYGGDLAQYLAYEQPGPSGHWIARPRQSIIAGRLTA